MSSRRHRARTTDTSAEQSSLPPTDPSPPPPPEDPEGVDGDDHRNDGPPRRDDGPSDAARGVAEINQEAVTTAVLEALANPEVIRRLLTVVSPEGSAGSASSRTASSSSGKLSITPVMVCSLGASR